MSSSAYQGKFELVRLIGPSPHNLVDIHSMLKFCKCWINFDDWLENNCRKLGNCNLCRMFDIRSVWFEHVCKVKDFVDCINWVPIDIEVSIPYHILVYVWSSLTFIIPLCNKE